MSILFMCLFLIDPPGKALIKGTLLDSNGRPVSQGNVEWHPHPQNLPTAPGSFAVNEQGIFLAEIEVQRLGSLRFSTPNHEPLSVPLFLPEPFTGEWTVQMGTFDINPNPNSVRVIGDFNDFSFSTSLELQLRPDGTYARIIPWDKPQLAFQVVGLVSRSINGTQSGTYRYDGGGDYETLIPVRGGLAEIVVDLSRYPPARPAQIEMRPAEHPANVLARVLLLQREWNKAFLSYRPTLETQTQTRDWRTWHRALEGAFALAESATKAGVGLACLGGSMPLSPEWRQEHTQEIRQLLALDSPLWALMEYPDSFLSEREMAEPGFAQAYLQEGVVPTIKAAIWTRRYYAALKARDEAAASQIHRHLIAEFGGLRETRWLPQNHDPRLAVWPGFPVPDFDEALIGEPCRISRKTMLGKTYLVEFWATGCGPCVAEMPNLHVAFELYHGKGLEIISFSQDRDVQAVHEFRKKRFKMPWNHVWSRPEKPLRGSDQPGSNLEDRFEVTGIPSYILVGPDGTILYTTKDLRQGDLFRTLAGYFGPP